MTSTEIGKRDMRVTYRKAGEVDDGPGTAAVFVFMLVALLLGLLAPDPASAQLRGPIRNLTADTTPTPEDMLLVDKATPLVSRKLTIDTLSTYLTTYLSGLGVWVPVTRTITCTAPLLCAGGTSMDLSANRTLAISPAFLTSTTNGGPVTWLTVGSTVTGASNQGIRKGLFTLFSTSATDEDNALITINTIQRSHVSGLARTGIDIRSYTEPDIGGDTSGILDVSTGGGTAASFYLYPNLRPTGFTDYSTSSLQPAVEIGTSTSRPALGVITGVSGTGTYHGIGIRVRLDNTISDGIYVEPANNTYDSTRFAYLVGNWQQNAAPVNVKFSVLMNGNLTSAGSGTFTGAISASNFSGTHSGTSSGTNTGDQTFSTLPGTATAAQTPLAVILGGTSGGQTINGDTASGGNLTLHSTANATKGKILFGTSAYDEVSNRLGVGITTPLAPLVVSTNSAALPSPTTGTVIQVGGADTTSTRIEIDAFGSGPAIEGKQAQGTAASPTATQATNTLLNLTAFGYGATGYSSGGRGFIQVQANQNWTDSNQGTKLMLGTTENNTTTALTQLTLADGGHLYATGTAPTVSCTGTGTSPAAPTVTGNDLAFKVTINTGTGSPASSGTCTVTYHIAYDTNNPMWACQIITGATAWGNGANIQVTTESLTAPVFTWYNLNNGALTALATSTSYKFSCINIGRL
jgi:hypothetical protein